MQSVALKEIMTPVPAWQWDKSTHDTSASSFSLGSDLSAGGQISVWHTDQEGAEFDIIDLTIQDVGHFVDANIMQGRYSQ